MGLLQTHKERRRGDSRAELGGQPLRFLHAAPPEDMTGRHEPQILVERIVPKDPYAAWLEQRDTEREREDRPEIRWVTRQRGPDGRGIVAHRL